MVDCSKCVHHDGCVEQFRRLKAEGYYDDDYSLEDHFKMISEAKSCDFFYPKPEKGIWSEVLRDGRPYKDDAYGIIHKCSVCGGLEIGVTNFYSSCGADMRGETNDS